MAGTWPNLDAADLEARVRTYLNEVTADFYTQAEIYRWLSVAVKDISQKALSTKRIIDAVTIASTRNVATSVYRVLHVEYVPSSGREQMLTRIDPLRAGHYPGVTVGTEGPPLYWYEFGSNIGIDPVPDAAYKLRLYVADLPKMQFTVYPISNFGTAWTATGSTWTNATTAAYAGTTGQAGTNRYTTALTAATNYTFTCNVTLATNASLVIQAGTAQSPSITTNGIHAVNILSGVGAAGTALTLAGSVTAGTAGSISVCDLYILKEADYGTAADQTELSTAWQHLLALYATYGGLTKDRKFGPAKMLESIYSNELAYLRQSIVEVIPDGKNDLKY